MREASANSTTARVASASVLTPSPVGAAVTPSITNGPTRTPTTTNTIAVVTGVPVSRRDTAATARTVAATIANSHFMALSASVAHPVSASRRGAPRRPPGAGLESSQGDPQHRFVGLGPQDGVTADGDGGRRLLASGIGDMA